MSTGYCQILTDCNRILAGKVKFSNALSALGPDTKNKGNILLASSGILMNNGYYGKNIRFEFRFVNAADLTEYQIWKQAASDGPKNMIYVDNGKTTANKVVAGFATINAAGWSGAAALDDLVILITDSNMSVTDAEDLVNDIEAAIDDVLRQESIVMTPEGTIPADLHFVLNPPVPRQIKTAAAYAFCYRAINDLLKAGRSLRAPSGKEELTDEDFAIAYQWLKVSDKALKDYIKTYVTKNAGNAPRWSGWQPLQGVVGVKGQHYGALPMDIDGDYTDENAQLDTAGKIEDNMNSSNAG